MANAITRIEIRIDSTFGSTWVVIGEITFFDSAGNPATAPTTVYASTEYSGWGAAGCIDGSNVYAAGTAYSSDGSAMPQYLYFDWSAPADIARVDIKNTDTTTANTEHVADIYITASHDDGSTYGAQTYVSATRDSADADAVTSHTIPPLTTTPQGWGASFPPLSLVSGHSTAINAGRAAPASPLGLAFGHGSPVVLGFGMIMSPLGRASGLGASVAPTVNTGWGASFSPLSLAFGHGTAINAGRAAPASPLGLAFGHGSPVVLGFGMIMSPLGRASGLGASVAPTVNTGWGASFPPLSLASGHGTAINAGRAAPTTPLGLASGRCLMPVDTASLPTRISAYWLRIATTPSLALYAGQRPRLPADIGLSMPRLAGLLPIRRPLSVPQLYPAEISNASADIDNADGAISRLWTTPPVRVPASMYLGEMKLMDGVITGIKMGSTIVLDLDAGLRAPITDTLPLRTSIVWGAFKDVKALPWVYGRVTLIPVAYDSTLRMFVLADHVIQGVDEVKIDGVPVQAFVLHHAEDSTGQTVAFLELATPLESGKTLSASVRGKMHPGSGALLTRPDAVLHDLIVNQLGITLAIDALDKLRSSGAEVELGGVFDNASMTVKEAIDTVVQSFGGAWSFGSEDVVIFDPWADDTDKPTALEPTVHNCVNMALESNHSNLASVVRITYDHDYSKNAPRRALQIEAPEAINEYGRIEREWSAPWLKSPRQAELLARRLLGHLARPQWQATWHDATQPPPSPGDFADLANHPYAALQGRHRLLVADIDPDTRMTQCKVTAPIGDIPRMELKALSTAFEPDTQSVDVTYAQGVATFTVRNQDGNPLQGASVTINGKITRITDSAGRVSFTTPRGKATLLIKAQGMADNTVEVTV